MTLSTFCWMKSDLRERRVFDFRLLTLSPGPFDGPFDGSLLRARGVLGALKSASPPGVRTAWERRCETAAKRRRGTARMHGKNHQRKAARWQSSRLCVLL